MSRRPSAINRMVAALPSTTDRDSSEHEDLVGMEDAEKTGLQGR
jgi:hypothetical protein